MDPLGSGGLFAYDRASPSLVLTHPPLPILGAVGLPVCGRKFSALSRLVGLWVVLGSVLKSGFGWFPPETGGSKIIRG